MRREINNTNRITTHHAEAFLRSIHVTFDANYPERIQHYHPTSKSAVLLQALLGQTDDRAFLFVAPYGTGKSISAAYLLQMVENRPSTSEMLSTIADRLSEVSPELGRFAHQRRKARRRMGPVFVLHGHAPSLAESLKTAALEALARLKLGRQARPLQQMPCHTMTEAIVFLKAVQQKVCSQECDRIIIVWDEFGRHLEALQAEGHPEKLLDLQVLAEFVARSTVCPMTLGLLLHQGLFQYAGHLPQSVRSEWIKVEGRFRTIQYLDDSHEIYRLISEVVRSQTTLAAPSKTAIAETATQCKHLGLFTSFTQDELEDLIAQAYPLTPITLYLLPRLASRIAQNERTLFSFLYGSELSEPIHPALLFDYFSPLMRADTSVGGTYRQWLETQSALSKRGDNHRASEILKTVCLLGLGASVERARISRELLLFGLDGHHVLSETETLVDELIEQKLLLYRQHHDEIAVWHGTDVDLRGRLETTKDELRDHFDLLDFLHREAPPPIWRPTEYNAEFNVRRFLSGKYILFKTLKATPHATAWPPDYLPLGCDGRIHYVIAQTQNELHDAKTFLSDLSQGDVDHLVTFALPSDPLPLYEAALEVASLLYMQLDADLVAVDPLIMPELQQMTDDAQAHLQQLIQRLTQPDSHGPRWFHGGCEFVVSTPRELRSVLSSIMRRVYGQTPKINNEMIIRQKPAPPLVNARRKLLLGILEHSGQADLGITGQGPDASILRTVLLHPNLYRQANGRWWYAEPEELIDPGLREVWSILQQFLTTPEPEPKAFASLFTTLMSPPFGVRAGLLPILIATALQAFPSAYSLMKEGAYITDILPSVIEHLCREPDAYHLLVLDIDDIKQTYLQAIYACFSNAPIQHIRKSDLIRTCFDAIEHWKSELPPAALTTQEITETTRHFQTVLRRPADPLDLLFHQIPAVCGYPIEQLEALLEVMSGCQAELINVAAIYRQHAASALRRALTFNLEPTEPDVRSIARKWAACFSPAFTAQLPDPVTKGFLARISLPYDSDDALIESLASLLVSKVLSRWQDQTVKDFDYKVRSVVQRIEEIALATDYTVQRQSSAAEGLAVLIRGRMTLLYERLTNLVDAKEAQKTLLSLTSQTSHTDQKNIA